jgi:hypothetical protein
VPSDLCREAIRHLTRIEGILLEKGRLGSNEPLIFLHSGDLPALFAFHY